MPELLTIPNIAYFVTTAGVFLGFYNNWRTAAKSKELETIWKTRIDSKLEIIGEDVKELKIREEEKSKSLRIHEQKLMGHENKIAVLEKSDESKNKLLLEQGQKLYTHENKICSIEKEIAAIWKRMDEAKVEREKIKENNHKNI